MWFHCEADLERRRGGEDGGRRNKGKSDGARKEKRKEKGKGKEIGERVKGGGKWVEEKRRGGGGEKEGGGNRDRRWDRVGEGGNTNNQFKLFVGQ